MILFKKYRERLKLLEYENEILAYKLQEIEKQLKPIMPKFPFCDVIREDGWDLTYGALRKKYRKHEVKYNDGLN